MVQVTGSGGAYPVLVAPGLRHEAPRLVAEYAPAHRYALISDSQVAAIHGEDVLRSFHAQGMEADLFTFPAGERHKTRKHWSILTDALLDAGLGRDGAVVAVGGGVTGDLAGFVAATLMRGVPVVQVPTSLVAMIDASVGGKTGVDVRAGKNLVGAFHPPRAVLVDPETVVTLPVAERAQGLAEALKHGAIADRGYFGVLVAGAGSLMDGDVPTTHAAVLRSVQIKAGIVSADEREGGIRQVLNFGHTYGHALEAASGYSLGHGSAVALGMILEARLGEALGVTTPGTADALVEALASFGLGDRNGCTGSVEEALSYLAADKKARRGRPRFVLLEGLGKVAEGDGWSHDAPPSVVEETLRRTLG